MKIIHNTDTIQVTCTHCKSILEIVRKDVDYTPVFGHGTRIDVDCPVCLNDFSVADVIPQRWKDRFIQEHAEDEE